MGMIYRKGHFYGGGTGGDVEVDNSIIISYEEYLNLSDEEKDSDTTYFVPDYPAGVVDLADIVDNLDSTDVDKALSANQGSIIKNYLDSLGEFKKKVESKSNISLLDLSLENGLYYVSYATDYPLDGVINFGFLIVIQESTNYRKIIWSPYNSNEFYIRTCSDGTWSEWDGIVRKSDIEPKEIGLNFGFNVSIESRNICCKINGTYYIDILFTNYGDVSDTTTPYLQIIEDGQPITFNKRVDVCLINQHNTAFLLAPVNDTSLYINGTILKTGVYKLNMIYRP